MDRQGIVVGRLFHFSHHAAATSLECYG